MDTYVAVLEIFREGKQIKPKFLAKFWARTHFLYLARHGKEVNCCVKSMLSL